MSSHSRKWEKIAIGVADDAIRISAISRLIKLSQRHKAVRTTRWWLRRLISEKFNAGIDQTITIPIQRQECVVSSGFGPCYALGCPVIIQVKANARRSTRQIKSVADNIHDNRRVRADTNVADFVILRKRGVKPSMGNSTITEMPYLLLALALRDRLSLVYYLSSSS